MLSHVLPIVVVSLSLTGLGIGAPVSGVADTPALESKQAKAVATPHSEADAFQHAHVFAQLLDSPAFHNVVTDAESPAHCVCPKTTVVYHHNGHCQCISNHSRRAEDPVSNLSTSPSKSLVAVSKSTVTVPRLSVTAPSSFVTISKSSVTEHNTSESTALDTVIVKPTVLTDSGRTVTAKVIAVKPTGVVNSLPIEPVPLPTEPVSLDPPTQLPTLVRPTLVCFSGACFASNQLPGLTGNIFQRQLVPFGMSCKKDSLMVCLADGKRCYCHIRKPSMPKDSIAHYCPDDQLLVCRGPDCFCGKNSSNVSAHEIKPIGFYKCKIGSLTCVQSLCFCSPMPLLSERSEEANSPGKIAMECAHDKPLICLNEECFCYVGPSQQLLPFPGTVAGTHSMNPHPGSFGARLLNHFFHPSDVVPAPTPTPVISARSWDAYGHRYFMDKHASDASDSQNRMKETTTQAPSTDRLISVNSEGKPIYIPSGI